MDQTVHTTLVVHWLFSCLTMTILTVRCVWRKGLRQAFTWGDYLTMAALLCALTRTGLIHVVLTWGTSNISEQVRAHHVFTATEIYQRETGSKLSLANRIFYNSYLWLQKLVLLDLYRRLIQDLKWSRFTLSTYLFIFFASYVAVQVTTFSECHPVSLYWQVVPDPGKCAAAQVQLVVLGVLNIVTDCMLIILPIPVLRILQAPLRRKLQLYALFALGIFIVGITAIRLPINALNKNSQDNRTVWASTELLTSAIAVNAPTLVSLWKSQRRNQGKTIPKRVGQDQEYIETIGKTYGIGWHRSKRLKRNTKLDSNNEDGDTILNTADHDLAVDDSRRHYDYELEGGWTSKASSMVKATTHKRSSDDL